MTQLDWRALMRLGLEGLRLTPEQFWALSPIELQIMAGVDGKAPMSRSGLDALMASFPDKFEGDGNE